VAPDIVQEFIIRGLAAGFRAAALERARAGADGGAQVWAGVDGATCSTRPD
jgi:hypothetical protein